MATTLSESRGAVKLQHAMLLHNQISLVLRAWAVGWTSSPDCISSTEACSGLMVWIRIRYTIHQFPTLNSCSQWSCSSSGVQQESGHAARSSSACRPPLWGLGHHTIVVQLSAPASWGRFPIKWTTKYEYLIEWLFVEQSPSWSQSVMYPINSSNVEWSWWVLCWWRIQLWGEQGE